MKRDIELEATLVAKYAAVGPVLDERSRRRWAAAESLAIGYGGDAVVSSATGVARETIRKGRREIARDEAPTDRIRRPGGGRPRIQQDQPGIQAALQALVDPLTRGDPTSPLRWTCKSRAKLAAALNEQGWRVSSTTVGRLLHRLGYRLQSPRKRQEGATHPDRNAQFEHINQTADEHLTAGQPVISVDTKKKELVGNFKNGGREWQPKGTPPAVLVHDFPTDAEGKAIPYGVYDMARNEAWVSVGWDHDTPAFAVASIRHWWHQMGCGAYPEATTLFITADAGGSNGYRLRAWKHELQQLADETGLTIEVSHFPPGTSKWNKIEHRLFCHITDATHTARLIHVRESTLHHFASAALQATTPPPPHTPAVRIQRFLRSTLLRRRLARLLVLPAATAALRLRYVTPNPYLAEPHQRLVAVIALVGHHLFDPRALRLHRFNLFGRDDQRLRQRGRITVRCILHRHRDDGARVHVDPVLGLVSQVRPTVLHLRDLRVRILRRFPLLVRRLLVLPRPVEPSQLRPRRRLHTRRFRQPTNERLVGFARVPTLDAPHRRVRFQRRRINADRLPDDQTRFRQALQNPREDRLVRLHVDQPARPRQRRVIRRRLGQLQVQERPQAQ